MLAWVRGNSRHRRRKATNVASPAHRIVISVLVNVGMWFERFVIIVTSLHRSFLPSSWSMYRPTIVEVGTLVGSFGLFFTCFLLFIRLLPMIAIWEMKATAVAEGGQQCELHV